MPTEVEVGRWPGIVPHNTLFVPYPMAPTATPSGGRGSNILYKIIPSIKKLYRWYGIFGWRGKDLLLLQHVTNHVLQNATVSEVGQFHFGVEAHRYLELLTAVHRDGGGLTRR